MLYHLKGFVNFKGLTSDSAGTRTQDPYIKSVLLYQLSYEIIPCKNRLPGQPCLFWECKDNNIHIPSKLQPVFFQKKTAYCLTVKLVLRKTA